MLNKLARCERRPSSALVNDNTPLHRRAPRSARLNAITFQPPLGLRGIGSSTPGSVHGARGPGLRFYPHGVAHGGLALAGMTEVTAERLLSDLS